VSVREREARNREIASETREVLEEEIEKDTGERKSRGGNKQRRRIKEREIE